MVVDDGRVAEDGPPETVLDDRPPVPAGAVPARSERIPVPRDPALPRMSELLDEDVMADVLGRSLGEGAGRPDVRVCHLRYRPHASLVVRYDVAVDGRPYQATATIANRDLGRRARKPANLALADVVNGRSPATRPLFYEDALGALVQWLPLDLSLPGLVEPPSRLRRRLRDAGVPVAPSGPEPPRLAYRPRRRAVLRMDGHVLKAYATEGRYRAAEARLRAISGNLGVPTAPFAASLPDLRMTVQPFLPGDDPSSARASARMAGVALERLHRSPVEGLGHLSPAHQQDTTTALGEALKTIAPQLGGRIDALVERLRRTLPPALHEVPCHGDFHVGQLRCMGDVLAVIDFDDMTLAPPALDLATYAAHEVWRDQGDLAAATEILEELVEGYGSRPEGLDWYFSSLILRRASHPFRHFRPDWPDRVEEMLAAAEAALQR